MYAAFKVFSSNLVIKRSSAIRRRLRWVRGNSEPSTSKKFCKNSLSSVYMDIVGPGTCKYFFDQLFNADFKNRGEITKNLKSLLERFG